MPMNAFDDANFFEQYQSLRNSGASYNELVEQPAMRALLPDVRGMQVLDLGCGYGDNCMDFIRRGAQGVVGIDSAQRMLAFARAENAAPGIRYHLMDMADIDRLEEGPFGLAYSSLAFHYVQEFDAFAGKLYRRLAPGGILLFSQEHPMVTAPPQEEIWLRGPGGEKEAALVADYLCPGPRDIAWFNTNIHKYHRPVSDIVNCLVANGFVIAQLVEPAPDDKALAVRGDLADELLRPTCLIVKALRPAA